MYIFVVTIFVTVHKSWHSTKYSCVENKSSLDWTFVCMKEIVCEHPTQENPKCESLYMEGSAH